MTGLHIQRKLQQATGLDLSVAAVENAVRKRMRQRHIGDASVYETEAMRDPEEFCALIDLVVVPETWFFRDPEAFSVTARFALDLHASTGRTVRVLSAPCATGEEPYSLAIALLDAGLAPASFVIDAVDVSRQIIQRAQQGDYTGNAFRTRDLGFRDRHFIGHGEKFQLAPEILKLVNFRRANLLTLDPLDGLAYDVIFCRNLLIYFNEATQATAIRKLRALLHDDGLLFCGYAETTTFCLHNFARAPYSNAFAVHKKKRAEPKAAPAGIPFRPRPARIAAMTIGTAETQTIRKPVTALQPPVREAEAKKDNHDALLEQANLLADHGSIDEASRAYGAYLELVPDSAQANFMLGLLSEHRGDDKSAQEFLRRAVYLDPHHYEALCHLALLAERHDNKAGARNYRQRAARVFEKSAGEHKE